MRREGGGKSAQAYGMNDASDEKDSKREGETETGREAESEWGERERKGGGGRERGGEGGWEREQLPGRPAGCEASVGVNACQVTGAAAGASAGASGVCIGVSSLARGASGRGSAWAEAGPNRSCVGARSEFARGPCACRTRRVGVLRRCCWEARGYASKRAMRNCVFADTLSHRRPHALSAALQACTRPFADTLSHRRPHALSAALQACTRPRVLRVTRNSCLVRACRHRTLSLLLGPPKVGAAIALYAGGAGWGKRGIGQARLALSRTHHV